MLKIHPTAIVDPAAVIHPDARVGPCCVIGPEVTIGEGTVLMNHVTVQRLTTIGSPIGRQPCATTLSTTTLPLKATPTAPERRVPRFENNAFAPDTVPPLASPPILTEFG